jgi:MFS family permease
MTSTNLPSMANDTNRRDSDSDSDTFDYLGKGSMADEESRRGSDSITDSYDELQNKDVERLGRIRPSEFSTTLHEAIFVCVIVLSLMMSEYFTSGFTIILPTLGKVFQVKDGDRTWPTAAPNLATAAFLLPCARLCDQYGSRRIFLFGHVWLFIWSVINGFCLDTVTIVVCRAMQGIGLAAFLPAGLAILGRIYRPGPRKNLIYCVYGAFACIGFYFGILMAAVAAQYIDWRWYFWIGAILEVVVLAVGFVSIPRLKDANPDMKMDWWGFATIVPGVTLVVFAFSDGCNAPQGWRTPYILVTLGFGCLSLMAAVYTQGWVSAQPLLPMGIFKPKYIKRLMGGLFCYYGVFSLFLFYSSL